MNSKIKFSGFIIIFTIVIQINAQNSFALTSNNWLINKIESTSTNLETEVNIIRSGAKVDYSILQFELNANDELGSYKDKSLELVEIDESNLTIISHKSLLTYHLQSEYALDLSDKEALTLSFYFGGLINLEKTNLFNDKNGFSGFAIGLKLKTHALSILYESGQNNIRSTKLGLTYQL